MRTRELAVLAADGASARGWWLTALTALAPVAWGTTYLVTTEFLPPERPLFSGAIRATRRPRRQRRGMRTAPNKSLRHR